MLFSLPPLPADYSSAIGYCDVNLFVVDFSQTVESERSIPAKKINMKKISFAICFFWTAALHAQKLTTLSKPTYSIKYPSTWELDPSSNAKQFTVKAPADDAADVIAENLNVVIENLPTVGYTAEQYATFSKGYLPQKVKNFMVLQSKKGNIAGKDSWYTTFKGQQNNKKLQWKQYYIVFKGKVHILTFTAAPAQYSNYLKTVDAMIASYVAK